MINTKFKVGKTEYQVTSITPISSDRPATIKIMNQTGKDLFSYFAAKVLPSGKLSKNGGMFYRFTESGNFMKAF